MVGLCIFSLMMNNGQQKYSSYNAKSWYNQKSSESSDFDPD